VNIKWAMFINTGVNKELLTVTFFLKRFAAMGAFKRKFFQVGLIGIKG
jgi:low affinity Fe/Cu permease